MSIRRLLGAALLVALPLLTFAQTASHAMTAPLPQGYLCCNLRSDGEWISDISYVNLNASMLTLGTPIKVTGYGRFRAFVDVNGGKQALGSDYSRDLSMEAVVKRYVVTEDPKSRLAGYPEKIRQPITTARLAIGTSREQVVMAVGYPVSSENSDLGATTRRSWITSDNEYQVEFGADNRVSRGVVANPLIRHVVVLD